uniref:Dematin actin binding protein n=1 Tax=Sus scrofa TaxID=9823 RepID=A0A8D2ABF5_PIG
MLGVLSCPLRAHTHHSKIHGFFVGPTERLGTLPRRERMEGQPRELARTEREEVAQKLAGQLQSWVGGEVAHLGSSGRWVESHPYGSDQPPLHSQRSLSPKSTSPPPSPEVWAESRSPGTFPQASAPRTTGTPRTSLPHFHHPETTRPDSNIYKKPPIYKQREPTGGSPQSKHLIEDLIIESSKFPAAQPPDPNQPAKIETDYWPCPPSLAVVETEWRKRKASRRGAEEEEEEEDDDSGEEMKALRERQREELSKVTSNLGKMILKEEMEKSLPIRRKTRSLPDRTPFHTSLQAGTSKSSSLPAYGRTTLSRLQSTDFSPSGSETESPGLQVSASRRGTDGAQKTRPGDKQGLGRGVGWGCGVAW